MKNKGSAAYWVKLAKDGIIWMGYDLDFKESNIYGDVYKIVGLIDSPHRIAPEIEVTSLIGTSILFTQHFQYAPREKRPNASIINSLLEL